MKNKLHSIKTHWFLYSTIFLSILIIISLVIFGVIINNNQTKSIVEKDADLVYELNTELASKPAVIFQINTIYNYYKSLGYNLEEEKYTNTRQEILKNIQDDYATTNLFNNFLLKNNILSENTKKLQEKYKNLKTGSDLYSTYEFYKSAIKEEALFYIIKNKLIDIEKDKNELQNSTNITDNSVLYEMVFQNNRDKFYEILLK